MSSLGFVRALPAIPVILVHLAGVIVAGILIIRRDGSATAPVLALIGFGLLLVLDVANFARGPVIGQLLRRTAVGDRAAVTGVSCCCGLVDVAAAVCLIAAVWQALTRSVGEGAG